MNAFNGLPAGFTVRMFCNTPAQVAAGSAGWPVRQGTGVPPMAANWLRMVCWPLLGANMLLLVSRGTADCFCWRGPSYAKNINVLSFFGAKPKVPPNCWRLREFLTGCPWAVSENGWPGV